MGELEEEITSTKEQYQKLEERLKIHQQLTNIEARIKKSMHHHTLKCVV